MMEYIEDDLFIIYIEDAPLGLETIENSQWEKHFVFQI